jgi:chromatin assembly factor 1 subunit A
MAETDLMHVDPSPPSDDTATLKRKSEGHSEELSFPCKKVAVVLVPKIASADLSSYKSMASQQQKLTKDEREALKLEKTMEKEIKRQKREQEELIREQKRLKREEEKQKLEEERLLKVRCVVLLFWLNRKRNDLSWGRRKMRRKKSWRKNGRGKSKKRRSNVVKGKKKLRRRIRYCSDIHSSRLTIVSITAERFLLHAKEIHVSGQTTRYFYIFMCSLTIVGNTMSDYEKYFQPFHVRQDVTVAPIHRFVRDKDALQESIATINKALSNPNPELEFPITSNFSQTP